MGRPEPYNPDDLARLQTNQADEVLVKRILKCMSDSRDLTNLRILLESENPLISNTARHYLNTNRLYKVAHGMSKRRSTTFPLNKFMPPSKNGVFIEPIPPLDLPEFNNCINKYLRNHGTIPCKQISALFFDHNSPYTFIEFVHCYSKKMQRFVFEKLAGELLEFSARYCCVLEQDEPAEQKLARRRYQKILEYYIKLYSSVGLRIYKLKTSLSDAFQSQSILQSENTMVTQEAPTSSAFNSIRQCSISLAVTVAAAPPTPDIRELASGIDSGAVAFTDNPSAVPVNGVYEEAASEDGFDHGAATGLSSGLKSSVVANLASSGGSAGHSIVPSGVDNFGEFFQCECNDPHPAPMDSIGRFPHELILEQLSIGECIRALSKPYSRLNSFLRKCCSIDPLRFFKALKIYNSDGSFNHDIYNFRLHCPLTKQFAAQYKGNLAYPYHLYNLDLDLVITSILTQGIYENYINSRRIPFTSALIGNLLCNVSVSQISSTSSKIKNFEDKVKHAKTGREIYKNNVCISFIQLIGLYFKQSLDKYSYLLQKPDTFIANGHSYAVEPENDRSNFVDTLKIKAFTKLAELLQVFVERAIMTECNWSRSSFDNADSITYLNVLKFVSYNDIVLRYYKHVMSLIETYDSIANTAARDVFLSSYVPPPEDKRPLLREAFADETIYHPCIITSIYFLQFLKEQLGLIESSEDSYTTQLAHSLLSSLESSPIFAYYYTGAHKILLASLSSLLINHLYLFTASEPGDFRTSIYMDTTNISDTLQRLMRHFSLASLHTSGSEIVMLCSHTYPIVSKQTTCGGSGELSIGSSVQSFEEYIDTNNFLIGVEEELDSWTFSPATDSNFQNARSASSSALSAGSTMYRLQELLKKHGKVYLFKPRSVVYNEAYEIILSISNDPEVLYVFLILMDGALYAREISPLLITDNIYYTLLSSAICFKSRFHQLDLAIEKLNEISHYWFANRKMLKGLVLRGTQRGLMVTGPSLDFPGPTALVDIQEHYDRLAARLNDELTMKSTTKVIRQADVLTASLSPVDVETSNSGLCAAGDLISSSCLYNNLIKSKFSMNERALTSLPYPIKITFKYINMLAGIDVEELCRKSERLCKTTPIIDKLIPFSQGAYMAPLIKFSPYCKEGTVLFKKRDGFDWNEKLPPDLSFESLVIRATECLSKKSYKVDQKSRARIEKLALAAFKTRFEPFILLLLYINKMNIQYSLSVKLITLAVHVSFYFKHVLAICSLGRFLLPMKLKTYNKDLTPIELKVLARNASLIIYDTIHVYLKKYQMVIDRFLSHALGDNLYTQVNRYVMEDLTSIKARQVDKGITDDSTSTEMASEALDEPPLSAPPTTRQCRGSNSFSLGGIDSSLKAFFEKKRSVILSSKMFSAHLSGHIDASITRTPELSAMLKPSDVTLNIYFHKSRSFMKDIIDMFERKYFDQLETMEAVVCIIKYFIFQHVESFATIESANNPSGILCRLTLYEYFKRLEITDLICEQIYTTYCLGIPALSIT